MAARSPRGAFHYRSFYHSFGVFCSPSAGSLTCFSLSFSSFLSLLDSPRAVEGKISIAIDYTVAATSGTRTMPGSFDEDSEEEFDLDELSLGIRTLGIKDN